MDIENNAAGAPSELNVRLACDPGSYEMGLSYERLHRFPEAQAEAIGRHYAAHTKIAMEILKLIELRQYATDTTNVDAAIAYFVEQIKRNHRHDFGIDLEWANKE